METQKKEPNNDEIKRYKENQKQEPVEGFEFQFSDDEKNTLDIVQAIVVGVSNQFPLLSGIVTGIEQLRNTKRFQRLELLVKELGKNIEKISEEKINKNYLKSEEGISLFLKASDFAQSEYRKEKIKYLADFLASSSTQELSIEEEKDKVLEAINELSPLQISILMTLHKSIPVENQKLGSDYNPDVKDKPEFKYVLEKIIVDIYSGNFDTDTIETALISMSGIGVIEPHTRRWTTVGGKQGVLGYRTSKLGLTVIKYLSQV